MGGGAWVSPPSPRIVRRSGGLATARKESPRGMLRVQLGPGANPSRSQETKRQPRVAPQPALALSRQRSLQPGPRLPARQIEARLLQRQPETRHVLPRQPQVRQLPPRQLAASHALPASHPSDEPPHALFKPKFLAVKAAGQKGRVSTHGPTTPRQSFGVDLRTLMSSLPIVDDDALSHATGPASSFLSPPGSAQRLPPPPAPRPACGTRLAALTAVQRLPHTSTAEQPHARF